VHGLENIPTGIGHSCGTQIGAELLKMPPPAWRPSNAWPREEEDALREHYPVYAKARRVRLLAQLWTAVYGREVTVAVLSNKAARLGLRRNSKTANKEA